MLAIEAHGLHKTYSAFLWGAPHQALSGVELRVPVGTAFGLIGPNGAGKTTFIKAMLGIVRPTQGTIKLFGQEPHHPEVRARVGYLPERLELPAAFTPPQVLKTVMRLKQLRRVEPDIDAMLSRVGLSPCRDRKVGTFSKGMKQRLGLAAALLGQPELLVLDEPTDGLDPLARVEVRSLLSAELKRGATLFLNSHLLSETEQVCSRIAILDEGRVVREGTLEELKASGGGYLARFAPGADGLLLAGCGFVSTSVATDWRWPGDDVRALNAALDKARDGGALLVALSKDARNLEEVLAKAVEAPP
jgi:ABC-2 type transport system ATP-binding protein